MRPPNPRMANNGSGADSITIFTLGIDPTADADEEGNWVRTPVVGTTFLAIVTPSFSTGVDQNGSELSVTNYQVMLYTNTRPFPLLDSPVEWKKSGVPQGTLIPMGEAEPCVGGWAFMAGRVATNPDPTEVPYGA